MMTRAILAFLGAFLLSGCGSPGRWREEVQLHDGTRIVVDRYQSYGGIREATQSPPIATQEIEFTVPVTRKSYRFKSEYSADVGRANLLMVGLHILNNTPHLITVPHLCLAYNKWGRPNPPYVIFKHDGVSWQLIPLEELPAEFKEINLVVSTKNKEEKFNEQFVVTAEAVRKFNSSLPQPQYRSILREAIKVAHLDCGEMTYDGRGGWVGIGWFRDQPSYEACLKYCVRNRIETQYCPCNRFFEGGK